MSRDLPKPDHARNMRLIGYSDQGGRPDGVQVMVAQRPRLHRPHVLQGLQRRRRARSEQSEARRITSPAPPGTWNIHLQTHDDLLLVVNAKDMFAAAEFADERAYYRGQVGNVVGTAETKGKVSNGTRLDRRACRLRYFQPAAPRRIGFMPVEGGGIHRIWYTGGRWAYVSVLLDGFTDYIFMTVDMSDPAHPREAGRYWLPGMNQAEGERPDWPSTSRYGLHHAIVNGDTAYGAWRDAGLVMIDVADRAAPNSSRTGTGRRPSAAARTIACRCPTATCWSFSTRPCSIIRRTDSN